jgi:hypothetical protein
VSVDVQWIIGTFYPPCTERRYQYERSNITEAGDVVQQLANMSIHTSNCCTTWLLRNKIQTCLKIIKLFHKQSNHTSHDQTVCATACVAQIVWPCVGPLRLSLAVIEARFFVQPQPCVDWAEGKTQTDDPERLQLIDDGTLLFATKWNCRNSSTGIKY